MVGAVFVFGHSYWSFLVGHHVGDSCCVTFWEFGLGHSFEGLVLGHC